MSERAHFWVLLCTWSLLGACGMGAGEPPLAPEEGGAEEGGTEVSPPPPPPLPSSFQPAFHQALHGSTEVRTLTTFRLRVPVGRAGERLRVTFRSGDGSLTLQKATVARAGPGGALASPPVALTFSGAGGFTVGPRTHVRSDPVDFPVGFRDELAVSFEVHGALSASTIEAFPGSFMRSGALASTPDALGGWPWQRAIGLATLEVEGSPGRAFVAIGDSITEGYIDTFNDTRSAWPALVEAQLGLPVVNAGMSGQGIHGVRVSLEQEVFVLSGITDCLVLLGTNDLGALGVAELQARMTELLGQLEPFCRTWVSTLLPKERTSRGSYEQVKEDRLSFNAWLREQTHAEVIDLEAVMRSPADVHRFADGLDVDGIHPSAEGHRVMAAEVVRALRDKGL